MALVGVVIGGKTDTELIQPALDMLKPLGVRMSRAKNAALLAAQILGLKYDKIQKAYEKYRDSLQGKG